MHAADAAHLLAPARASGTAVHQVRQRRAVTGRFLRAVAVHHHDAPVIRRKPEHQARGRDLIGREHGAREAAVAAARQRDRLDRGPS